MLRHITDDVGQTLISNIEETCNPCVASCEHISQIIDCALSGKKRRNGFLSSADGSVFLCVGSQIKSSRRFKEIQKTNLAFLPHLIFFKKTSGKKIKSQVNRLVHNLITYNAHILQELYGTFPQDELASKGRNQINVIEEIIDKEKKNLPKAILRILKNAKMMQSEFSIYSKLYTPNPQIEIQSHPIHRVVNLVFNSFWLDFIDKNISINIESCYHKVLLDYETVSAALAHIFDNASKYIANEGYFNIKFSSRGNSLILGFEMLSLKVEPHEENRIFEEGFSGSHAQRRDIAGKGIGMFMVRNLLKLNKAEITFHANLDSKDTEISGNHYQKNRIEIAFPN